MLVYYFLSLENKETGLLSTRTLKLNLSLLPPCYRRGNRKFVGEGVSKAKEKNVGQRGGSLFVSCVIVSSQSPEVTEGKLKSSTKGEKWSLALSYWMCSSRTVMFKNPRNEIITVESTFIRKICRMNEGARWTLGERAFQAAAPHLWNGLPLQLRTIKSVETFKNSIKTFLFKQFFQ